MIKATILYPNAPGARFDFGYYRDSHMRMVADRLGAACKSCTIDKGVSGGAPGTPAPFIAIGHIVCESMEALAPHIPEFAADVPNYTNTTPVAQISEIVLG